MFPISPFLEPEIRLSFQENPPCLPKEVIPTVSPPLTCWSIRGSNDSGKSLPKVISAFGSQDFFLLHPTCTEERPYWSSAWRQEGLKSYYLPHFWQQLQD